MDRTSTVVLGSMALPGELCLVRPGRGLVMFAHGSGSSRHSRRNRMVAQTLQRYGLSTLLFDLLTPGEAEDRSLVFDIELLAARVVDTIDDLPAAARALPLGLFGASTGAAAALVAAALRPASVRALVSRGGRPDLANGHLDRVQAPTLLIVGGADTEVLELNRSAFARLRCTKQLEIVPRATHLFEEAGAMQTVASLAVAWFSRHLSAATSDASAASQPG